MRARIYQKPKSAMQSGFNGTEAWQLSYAPARREENDPLMGWWGSSDTQGQVSLSFNSKEAAIAYAEAHGVAFDLELPPRERPLKPKAYAENFRYGRTENWTH